MENEKLQAKRREVLAELADIIGRDLKLTFNRAEDCSGNVRVRFAENSFTNFIVGPPKLSVYKDVFSGGYRLYIMGKTDNPMSTAHPTIRDALIYARLRGKV